MNIKNSYTYLSDFYKFYNTDRVSLFVSDNSTYFILFYIILYVILSSLTVEKE